MSAAEILGGPATVPEDAATSVTVRGRLVHECPHKGETDEGVVAITWRCDGRTIELHALAGYLAGFQGVPISHERLTRLIREELSQLDGLVVLDVRSSWVTAGLDVRVES